MKYIDEYRNPELIKQYVDSIHKLVTKDWTIMELCGGQTHSLMRNGITQLLPKGVRIVHGPGCPVCVTPIGLVDVAIELSLEKNVILCSFGDMLRVPGTKISLLEAKSQGATVQIVYSPLDALKIAKNNPKKEVVFFSVGFETTAPANALAVIQAKELGLTNFSILCAQVLVPPAIVSIMEDKNSNVNAFLAAGHVCAIVGYKEYIPLAELYGCPIIVTGFEALDLIKSIYSALVQLESGKKEVENCYARYVSEEGNFHAQNIIRQVFEVGEREWRGIGNIAKSGYQVKETFRFYDAIYKFQVKDFTGFENELCQSGKVLKGILTPNQCPQFGSLCNPEFPLGAPMVSSEGACSAYHRYKY